MARVSLSSIPHGQPTHQSGLNHRLRGWMTAQLRHLKAEIQIAAAQCQAERYRKHFTAFAHACLLVFHGLSRRGSLRQSYAAFPTCRGLVEFSGLGLPDDPDGERLNISFSQFADSNTTRPADFLGLIVPVLIKSVYQQKLARAAGLPGELHIIDSTFLRLSMRLATWLPGRSGVRVQFQYLPVLDLPEHVWITDSRTNDCQGLDQCLLDTPARLAELRGQTLIVDLGYYSHQRFQRVLDAGVHLVTRLHPQASYQATTELPVQGSLFATPNGRIEVLRDQKITLGSSNNRHGAVLPGLRLITARVDPTHKAARRGAKPLIYPILTDRWDLTAEEVVQIYLYRWQIELFFRWLKSHIRLTHLLGYSHNAVLLSIWLALIIHLLTVLAAHHLGMKRRSPALLDQLPWILAALTTQDLRSGCPTPEQLTFPGWLPPYPGPT